MKIFRDIPYDASIGQFGLGDLLLADTAIPKAPVVLAIHGGGWRAQDRYSWSGVANFLAEKLGCSVFNIEYRLASEDSRWPACRDDCVKAANWLFSDSFRHIAGFSPARIWLCGGSSGGHLALWTLASLPQEKVAGCVSISSIGAPLADFRIHRDRYTQLLGADVGEDSLATIDPVRRITPGMAPLLCTHATEDTVVPIASHRAFADAYRAAGNRCTFFEYPATVRQGLAGHCIWIPDSNPNRLIPEIEAHIAALMRQIEQEEPQSGA